jgi:hypothetical protein
MGGVLISSEVDPYRSQFFIFSFITLFFFKIEDYFQE